MHSLVSTADGGKKMSRRPEELRHRHLLRLLTDLSRCCRWRKGTAAFDICAYLCLFFLLFSLYSHILRL